MSSNTELIAAWAIDGRSVWRVTLSTYEGQPEASLSGNAVNAEEE